jgi:hypothetical protein
MKRIVSQLTLKCSFDCSGKIYPFNEVREHMKKCELREYVCNFCYEKKKVFEGKKKDLLTHIANEHETQLLEFNDKYLNYDAKPKRTRTKVIERLLEEVKGELRDPYYINSNLGVNDYPSSEEEFQF